MTALKVACVAAGPRTRLNRRIRVSATSATLKEKSNFCFPRTSLFAKADKGKAKFVQGQSAESSFLYYFCNALLSKKFIRYLQD